MPEQASRLQIAEAEVGDVTVLTLNGEMRGDDGDLLFGRRVDALLKRGRLQIVVNLSGVTKIDSSGLGMIVAELKIVQKQGGEMKLASLSTYSHHLLGMLKLRVIFEIFDDDASAIQSFAWRRRSSS